MPPDTLDLVMADESKIARLQERAFVESLNQSMVYMLHLDRANNPGSGSGALVILNGRTYLVSALHNFVVGGKNDIDSIVEIWNETKFNVREVALQFNEPLIVPTNSGAYKGKGRSLLIDPDFDLIAVRLKPEEILPRGTHPINLEPSAHMGGVEPGATLTTLGLPIGGAQRSESGPKLVPYKFSAPFNPEVDKRRIPVRYQTDDYLLYEYTGNVGARGYSGAPVWIAQNADNEPLWKANPRIVGIVLKLFQASNLILAVRIKYLVALLERDILPDASATLRVG